MSSKDSHSRKEKKNITGPGFFDVLMPLAAIGRKKGPEPTYYLVRSKSGRPLNVSALRQKPASTSGSVKGSHSSGESQKSHGGKNTESKSSPPVSVGMQLDQSSSAPAVPEFTAEQDAKLLEMKAANKTWKDIISELGHSKSIWQARFKEIRPQQPNPKVSQQGNGKDDEAKGKKASSSHIDDTKAKGSQSSNKKSDHGKEETASKLATLCDMLRRGTPIPPGSASFKHGGNNEPRLTLSALLEVLEADAQFFSPRELRDLYRMLQGDEEGKWLRLASRFYDETGRRVHEEDVRDAVKALLGKSR